MHRTHSAWGKSHFKDLLLVVHKSMKQQSPIQNQSPNSCCLVNAGILFLTLYWLVMQPPNPTPRWDFLCSDHIIIFSNPGAAPVSTLCITKLDSPVFSPSQTSTLLHMMSCYLLPTDHSPWGLAFRNPNRPTYQFYPL